MIEQYYLVDTTTQHDVILTRWAWMPRALLVLLLIPLAVAVATFKFRTKLQG